jgi:hypothetical protein
MFLILQLLVSLNGLVAQDSIDVLAPDGGESINVGSTYSIQWSSVGAIVDVKIEYSIDGGSSWKVIIHSTTNDGIYDWSVPYTTSSDCFVRISDVDKNPVGVSDASFSIVDDGVARIIVTSPNGGETLAAESSHEITWLTTGTVGDVKIEYSTDNGTTWADVIASTENDGSYSWSVPTAESDQCLVRISEASDGDPTDTSNSTFSIVSSGSAALNLTFPKGGETLPGGFAQYITWTSTGTIFNVKLEYSINNGSSWTTISNGTSNDGSYKWSVPSIVSTECLVRISDALDGDPMDQSDSVFSIVAAGTPTITVTSPNGGENFRIGVPQDITWDSTGTIDYVHIEYSTNNGGSWTDIKGTTTNDGSYSWTVPNTPSSQCLVRISDAADGDPVDVSNSVFNITQPEPSITLTSPQGGDFWQVGSTHNITWTTYLTVGNVKIEYSSNNKSTWTTIAASTANDGSYSWTIPNTPSSACYVRISEAADGIPYHVNTSPFSIVTGSVEPEIGLNRTELHFASLKSSSAITPAQQLIITNSSGFGTLNWQVSGDASWLRFNPTAGSHFGVIDVSVYPLGQGVGIHSGTITVTSTDAANSPQTVNVTLTVYAALSDKEPFGSFETPVDGSTVMSSIPVTGWVLDDIGVEHVEIWRNAVQGEGSGQVYIGDALLVEGARPDVEQLYSSYPMSYKAGWGYMMLTNFLPNGGNGTFNLYAYATDGSGHNVLLGTKTITCDNAHAVKPFGAIDTPKQGGEASGSSFRNFGWVLTPMPNNIPVNGSTILVYIDGQSLGHPHYNLSRPDVTALFPGYANSSGPGAYFDFDTTTYSSGIHTIQWAATDNAGNADGIGSRYFSIRNPAGRTARSPEHRNGYRRFPELSEIPIDYSRPVGIIKGHRKGVEPRQVYPDSNGIIPVETRELERVEIYLNDYPTEVNDRVNKDSSNNSKFKIQNSKFYSGYQVVGNQLRSLPIGSTLDKERGIFYWLPGPGFLGTYRMIFFVESETGRLRKDIRLTITPGFDSSTE